ncbi:MAG: glycosyltransferase family 2 protein [Leptolyngbyaceae cyanobacterium CSU_1_4]|nr:glycosyltransferase family 2 protein [Leptolyngbyaceae cyanobacterium CSU_1_4]
MPKISVCIPTYNRVQLLPHAIHSVLKQTELDFELIICDDGSTDGTANLLAEYRDPRIHYIRHLQNIGKSNNMRSGFEAATGEYFLKFDDDDRLTPQFLAQTAAILDRDPQVDFVSTDHWVINGKGDRDLQLTDINSKKWGRTELPNGIINDLLKVIFVQQCLQVGATLFRRQALLDVGYMRPNMQNCEDNDLLVRLALAGKQAFYWGDRLMEYRFHAEQQGIHRAIPYFQDKIRYLENFQFEDLELEKVRQSRLAETKLLLGLRLIETGETELGRSLVRAGKRANPAKTWAGLGLSLLPMGLRQQGFQLFR